MEIIARKIVNIKSRALTVDVKRVRNVAPKFFLQQTTRQISLNSSPGEN